MRLVLASIAAAALLTAPAVADPIVKTSMPAILASVADGEIVVRLEQGVLGSVRSLVPRTIVLVAQDVSGRVIGESTVMVSRRMTFARTQLTPALADASRITVSVR